MPQVAVEPPRCGLCKLTGALNENTHLSLKSWYEKKRNLMLSLEHFYMDYMVVFLEAFKKLIN